MGAVRLTIGRLCTVGLVDGDHARPEAVGGRLDRMAERLGAALGPVLEGLFADAPDGAVCLIRRLDLDVALDPDGDEAEQRAAWAGAIATALGRRLSGGGDGVVRFADRAGQLAHLLDRLAAGDAWSLWYHEAFAGLRTLSASMALRTAILADPVPAIEALRRLDGWARFRILDVLGETGCRRVLDDLAARGDGEADPARIVEAAPLCRSTPGMPGRAALELYLAACGPGDARPGPATAALTGAVARVRAAAFDDPALLDALADGTLGAAVAASGSEGAALALALRTLSPGQRRALVEAAGAAATPPDAEYTIHGGLFLLLDALDGLPLPDPDDWPEPPGMAADALLRFLVLANGLGPERAPGIFGDPVWRRLFGLPPRLSPAAVTAWARSVPRSRATAWMRTLTALSPAAGGLGEGDTSAPPCVRAMRTPLTRPLGLSAAAMLQAFSRRLPGFAGTSAGHLRANFLSVAAKVERSPAAITATLARPPLDVVLAMSTLSGATLDLGWLGPVPIRIQREAF